MVNYRFPLTWFFFRQLNYRLWSQLASILIIFLVSRNILYKVTIICWLIYFKQFGPYMIFGFIIIGQTVKEDLYLHIEFGYFIYKLPYVCVQLTELLYNWCCSCVCFKVAHSDYHLLQLVPRWENYISFIYFVIILTSHKFILSSLDVESISPWYIILASYANIVWVSMYIPYYIWILFVSTSSLLVNMFVYF